MNKPITDYQLVQTLKHKSESEVFFQFFEKIVSEKRNSVLKHLVLTRPLLFMRYRDDCLHILLKNLEVNEKLCGVIEYLFFIKADMDYIKLSAQTVNIFLKNQEMVYIKNRLPNMLLYMSNEEFMKLKYSDIVDLLSDAIYLNNVKTSYLIRCKEQVHLERILYKAIYLSNDLTIIEKAYSLMENKIFPQLLHNHLEHYEIFHFLVEHGLNVNEVNAYGETPVMSLMHARTNHHQMFNEEKDINMLKLCLETGLNLSIENKEKKMIYDYALYGTEAVWKLLLQKTDYKNIQIIKKLEQLQYSLENQNSYNPLIAINKLKKILSSFLEKVTFLNMLEQKQDIRSKVL